MLRLLRLAADYHCEDALGEQTLAEIKAKGFINIQNIESEFNGSNPALPIVDCQQHTLANYDHYIPNHHHAIGGTRNATL